MVLGLAGVLALITWAVPGAWLSGSALVLFGALDQLEGPFRFPYAWEGRLPLVAAGLGLVALAAAVAGVARPATRRAIGRIAALVLALGTAYVVAWIADPPEVAQGLGQSSLRAGWAAFAAVAALGAGAVAAAWMALSRKR